MSLLLSSRRARQILLVPAALALSGAALSSCSSDSKSSATTAATKAAGQPTAAAAAGGTAVLKVAKFTFAPLTVAPGTKVTLTNSDTAPHNAVADDGSFKSDKATPGHDVTFTAPSKPGSYAYICTVHPKMKATLVVK